MKRIITTILLCATAISFAQQKELTLKDAIRYALEHKADAEKARLTLQLQVVWYTTLSYKPLILMLVLLHFLVCL